MPWYDTGERVGEHFTGYLGLAFREAKARYAQELAHDVARYLWNTLLGSMRTDANRFNVEGEFGAVYLSLDPKTPIRELERTYRRHAGTARPEDISADRILITLDVRLARVARPAGSGRMRDVGHRTGRGHLRRHRSVPAGRASDPPHARGTKV